MDKAKTDGPISFSKVTEVERLASHTYKVNLSDSYCIGTGKLTRFAVLHCMAQSKRPDKNISA